MTSRETYCFTRNYVEYNPVGILDTDNKMFDIYPNPASNYIIISGKENINDLDIEIYNISGKKVIEK